MLLPSQAHIVSHTMSMLALWKECSTDFIFKLIMQANIGLDVANGQNDVFSGLVNLLHRNWISTVVENVCLKWRWMTMVNLLLKGNWETLNSWVDQYFILPCNFFYIMNIWFLLNILYFQMMLLSVMDCILCLPSDLYFETRT